MNFGLVILHFDVLFEHAQRLASAGFLLIISLISSPRLSSASCGSH